MVQNANENASAPGHVQAAPSHLHHLLPLRGHPQVVLRSLVRRGTDSLQNRLKCTGGRPAPVSCVALFAAYADCSPRWCLSSGGLLSHCLPLCRSWLLLFFLGPFFQGIVWSSYYILQHHVFPPLRDSGALHLGLNRQAYRVTFGTFYIFSTQNIRNSNTPRRPARTP